MLRGPFLLHGAAWKVVVKWCLVPAISQKKEVDVYRLCK